MAGAVIKQVQKNRQSMAPNKEEMNIPEIEDDGRIMENQGQLSKKDLEYLDSLPDNFMTSMRRYVFNYVCGRFFEALCAVVILFNGILVIVETDQSVDDGDPADWVEYTMKGLLLFYVIELFLKLFAMRCYFFKDPWNVLDFSIVALDAFLFFLEFVADGLPSVAPLRVFRLIRLVRAFKAARSFHELNALIRSFAFAMKAICWGIGMIIILLTMWSILAVQMLHPVNVRVVENHPEIYSGCDRCHKAFSSVFEANLTFFQTVVAGDSWGVVALPIITEEPWTAVLFLAVIVTVNLTMLNLILAVIVEAGSKATEEDQHELAQEQKEAIIKAEMNLVNLCSALDKDSSGSLSIEEFLGGYSRNQDFADCLTSMNVSKSDINMIFNICDEDGSGDINYVEFVEQLRRIRSSPQQTLLYYVTELRHKVRHLKSELLFDLNHKISEMYQQLGADNWTKPPEGDSTKELLLKDDDAFSPWLADAMKQIDIGSEWQDGGTKLECLLASGTCDDKISLCSVQLANLMKINQDIVSSMQDVASQSKLQAGVLSTVAADINRPRTPRRSSTGNAPQLIPCFPGEPPRNGVEYEQKMFCMPSQPTGPPRAV